MTPRESFFLVLVICIITVAAVTVAMRTVISSTGGHSGAALVPGLPLMLVAVLFPWALVATWR